MKYKVVKMGYGDMGYCWNGKWVSKIEYMVRWIVLGLILKYFGLNFFKFMEMILWCMVEILLIKDCFLDNFKFRIYSWCK